MSDDQLSLFDFQMSAEPVAAPVPEPVASVSAFESRVTLNAEAAVVSVSAKKSMRRTITPPAPQVSDTQPPASDPLFAQAIVPEDERPVLVSEDVLALRSMLNSPVLIEALDAPDSEPAPILESSVPDTESISVTGSDAYASASLHTAAAAAGDECAGPAETPLPVKTAVPVPASVSVNVPISGETLEEDDICDMSLSQNVSVSAPPVLQTSTPEMTGVTEPVQRTLSPSAQPNLQHQFFEAIEQNNLPALVAALEQGADPNALDQRGRSILNRLIVMNDRSRAELLLKFGAKINQLDAAGRAVIHRVTDVNTALWLIQHGADLCLEDHKGMTPLRFAMHRRDYALIEVYLKYSRERVLGYRDAHGRTPILDAVYVGDFTLIEKLLLYGANPNAADNSGLTPLHVAVEKNMLSVVRLLVQFQAAVNSPDQFGATPIRKAFAAWNVDLITTLIAAGAEINHRDLTGVTIMESAVYHRDTAIIQFLVQHGAMLDDTIHSGETILEYALLSGYAEVAEFLLNLGADVNYRAPSGRTALEGAILNRDRDMADFLIAKGVDVNQWVSALVSPLHLALDLNDEDMAILLVTNGADIHVLDSDGVPPLIKSILINNMEIVNLLIVYGVDLNLTDRQGRTPLYRCLELGYIEIARHLLQYGADFNNPSLIHKAIENHQFPILEFLIREKADLQALNSNGKAPLQCAVENSHQLMVELLLQSGADVNRPDGHLNYPLHSVRTAGIAQLLIQSGARINVVNDLKQSPLMVALLRRDFEVASILIQSGADVNVQDQDGQTALFVAGDLAMVNHLLDHAANVHLKNNAEQTPLDLAIQNEAFELACLLVQRGSDMKVFAHYLARRILQQLSLVKHQLPYTAYLGWQLFCRRLLWLPPSHWAGFRLTELNNQSWFC